MPLGAAPNVSLDPPGCRRAANMPITGEAVPSQTGNHFLDSLEASDLAALQPLIKRVDLKRDAVLTKAGHAVTRAWLPIDCIASVITVMQDGRHVESRTIGRESGFGLLHALGSDMSFEEVICQVAGQAYAIGLADLSHAAARSPLLVRQIVRHAQATIVHSAQGTGCNALHDVRQRLCKWLLLTQDRLRSAQLPLTQEHLSIMLGVQRTTITMVASQMQKDGHIAYSRGKVTIMDRDAVLKGSCECYEAIENSVEKLLDLSAFSPDAAV
jgi:CRP-like cAMP-binding protein